MQQDAPKLSRVKKKDKVKRREMVMKWCQTQNLEQNGARETKRILEKHSKPDKHGAG